MNSSIRRLLVLCFALGAFAAVAPAQSHQFNGAGWNNGVESTYSTELQCFGSDNCTTVFCNTNAPGTIFTNLEWNAGFTMFGVTVPWYATPGAYNVSCSDGSYGTLTVYETVPIINAGGVVNDTYGGNTVAAGTSGYLSVYGIGLTAGGKTPVPTISVDDPSHISLTLSYAGDLQVNLHFTVSTGVSNGTHSLYITTVEGKSNAGTFTVTGGH